jgi:hypothetical protein
MNISFLHKHFKEIIYYKHITPAIRYGSWNQTNTEAGVMDVFLNKYQDQTTGIISVFDRIIFKGYLPIRTAENADCFLSRQGILLKDFTPFTKKHTALLKNHAMTIARDANRPYEYRAHVKAKDDYAKAIATRDHISDGLVCVLACNEENHSYALRYGKGRPALAPVSPHCLTFYFYYIDRHLGLMHIRLSAWLPFNIQIYVNGHEWLARQMTAHGIVYQQTENAFTSIADCPNAQRIANKLPHLPWEKILHAFARRVNPLLKTILKNMEYYWVVDQAEFATDVMCRRHGWLDVLYTKWQKHAAVCFQAIDIMRFMGRKRFGTSKGAVITDVKSGLTMTRVKHRVRGNWIKMYNKNGIVLRIETVINRPGEFRVFKLGHGKKPGYFQAMRKGVTNMHRFAAIGLRANAAYLDALAHVDDPVGVYREIARICEPVEKNGRRARPLNPLRENDRRLFSAVMRGEHHLHGFKANEIGALLGIVYPTEPVARKREMARVNRKLRLLRGHGLITRFGRSRRYRITEMGARHMNAAIAMYDHVLPETLKKAA